jgi:hypothetical protein
MLKGWHICRALTALSVNARCFADGAGTSKRGGDASVPSRLKEMPAIHTDRPAPMTGAG